MGNTLTKEALTYRPQSNLPDYSQYTASDVGGSKYHPHELVGVETSHVSPQRQCRLKSETVSEAVVRLFCV